MKNKNRISFTAILGLILVAGCAPTSILPLPLPDACESNEECEEGESCIDFECHAVESIECYADSECTAEQFCNFAVQNTAPAADPDGESCSEDENGNTLCGAPRMRAAGVCEDLPPVQEKPCDYDSDCAANEFCSSPYETLPAPDCAPDENCGTAYPAQGVCLPRETPPPQQPCNYDSDCADGEFCSSPYETLPAPDCAPDENCGEAYPAQGICFPSNDFYECASNYDCGPDAYCGVFEACNDGYLDCPAGESCPAEDSCELYSQCVPYDYPPNGECYADSDCGSDAYCELNEYCNDMPYPECDAGSDCIEPAPACEVYGQCVSMPEIPTCEVDADCYENEHCLANENAAPDSFLVGKCISNDISECEEQCLWSLDSLIEECFSTPNNDECMAAFEEEMNGCVQETCGELPPPPPACEQQCAQEFYGLIDGCALSGAGEECIDDAQLFYDTCQEECALPPPAPTCEEACLTTYDDVFFQCLEQGEAPNVCDQVATPLMNSCLAECNNEPSGECNTNEDCEQGGTCQTTEWCESIPCIDNNGDGLCDTPDGSDVQCGTESICVYEAPPPSECSSDAECGDGSCAVRTSCFFYCDVSDPECCFEIGECQVNMP